MKSIDLGEFGKIYHFQCTFLYRCRCTQLLFYDRLFYYYYYACNLLFLRSRPFVPFRPRSLSHFLLFFPRENSLQGLAALLSSNLSFFGSRELSHRRSPRRLGNRIFFSCGSGNDSIPKHSGWEEGERKREEGKSAIYQSRPLWLSSRSFTIPRANPTGIPCYSRCPIVLVCESSRCFFDLATNCRCDGRR